MSQAPSSDFQAPPRRFHGRVKMFFQNENYGYITELGETGTTSVADIVSDRDVYFRASDLRVANPHAVLRKSCTGHILEYERETDEQGRHRAYDITNLYETALPCEEGVVVFKRYYDINREALRREGARLINEHAMAAAQSHRDSAPQKRGRRQTRKNRHSGPRRQDDYQRGGHRRDEYECGGGGGADSTEYLDAVTRTDPDVDDLSMDGDAN